MHLEGVEGVSLTSKQSCILLALLWCALCPVSYNTSDAFEFCSIPADLNGEDHGSVDACSNSTI